MKRKLTTRTFKASLYGLCFGLTVLVACSKADSELAPQEVKLRFGSFTIEEAVDYLADSLNGRYCRPGDQFETTLVFDDIFYMPVDGSDEITEGNLEAFALEIAEWAGDQFHPRGAGSKAPFMFEIRQLGEEDNNEVPIGVWFIMEENDPLDEEDAYPYEDPWPYAHGSVIGCPTTPNGVDALDLFRRDLKDNVTYGGIHGSGGYAYIKHFTVCFTPGSDDCFAEEIPIAVLPADEVIDDVTNGDDPQSGDNFFDFLLFRNYSGYSNYHTCLSDDEMNFYYESMEELGEDQVGGPGVGSRQLVQVHLGYNELFSGNSTIHHAMVVSYAYVVPVAISPQVLPSTCC